MYAIVDCNNFYASCERLFKPDLQGKPIVVLSKNDGCVIARSNEARALGITMGQPYFQIEKLCKRHQVHAFSSNYALYGDMSRRVMSQLEVSWPDIEIYSIDEAFLDLSSLPSAQVNNFCNQLQLQVKKNTGIPVSIGIGASKTLAKLANHIAKRELFIPVFDITGHEEWLSRIAIGEVWGIGRKWNKKLQHQGVRYAADLVACDPRLLKRQYNLLLERIALELRGQSCIGLDIVEDKKQIISSKSFGCMQSDYEPIAEALSAYVARAVDKLYAQGSKTSFITVFIHTNRFRKDLPQYSKSISLRLINPSDDIREITHYAKLCLKKIFRPGYQYKKTGVMLSELSDKRVHQICLFDEISAKEKQQSIDLMRVFTDINQRFGRHSIKLAAEGPYQHWRMKSAKKSPNYTTSWSELPIVKAH